MCRVTADDRFVAVNIDSSVRTIVASGGILLQCGNTNICRDNNGIRYISGSIFLKIGKSGNLYDFAEQTTNVPCLDVAGVVIKAISCKTL